MRGTIFLVLIIFFNQPTFSQKEWNNWYFGKYAGLTFNSGNPVALTDGANFLGTNCGSISDSLGNLLFYTDGSKVYKRDHAQMLNGIDLIMGWFSQGPIILPDPGNKNLYYIIYVFYLHEHLYEIPGSGLHYAIVDMTKDNGKNQVSPVYFDNGEINLLPVGIIQDQNDRYRYIAMVKRQSGIQYYGVGYTGLLDSGEVVFASDLPINVIF